MRKYSLKEVFGVVEKPEVDCPTYIDRYAHQKFKSLIYGESGHIVVYGASRQGKSWLVERYCPSFVRVGCDAKFTRERLFKAILHSLGIEVGSIESGNSVEKGAKIGAKAIFGLQFPWFSKAETDIHSEVNSKQSDNKKISYVNIDLENQTEVISAINKVIGEKFILLENFHYMEAEVQKAFASSLREFLYHGIRVIIVGVWKEHTKINSFVPDLSDRIGYIDIGDWSVEELEKVVSEGERALRIKIDNEIIQRFIKASGRNVGIFKSLLKNFCFLNDVLETQGSIIFLDRQDLAEAAIEQSFVEVIYPSIDRIHNLATSKKSGKKGLRYYILRAILTLMAERNVDELVNGIALDDIVNKIISFNEETFQTSNIQQELGMLHLREETVYSEGNSNPNFIPLFYYDSAAKKVLIVESALLASKYKLDLSKVLRPKQSYVR